MKNLLAGARAWTVLAAVLALAILAGGWFLLVSPQFSNAAAIKAEEQEAKDQAAMLQQKALSLRKQAEQLPQLQAELARLASQLPDEAQEAELIKQIDAANVASGMTIQSFAAPPLTPIAAAQAAQPAAESTEGSASSSAAASSTPKAKSASLLSTQVQIQLTNGSTAQVIDYLNKVENLSRALILTNVQLAASNSSDGGPSAAPAPAGTSYTLAITGTIFARPAAPSASASATPSGASGGATAAPSATPSPSASR
ncbi:MAG: hypothetical protein E6Q90_01435 [Actinobacteria bacterium]|nr:MAG: hypothetical protein E6Q90_01435 [Actinomycetota bacterium]